MGVARELTQTFKADCPYCRTVAVAFTIHSERRSKGFRMRYGYANWLDGLAICNLCGRAVVAEFIFAPTGRYFDGYKLTPILQKFPAEIVMR